MILPLIVTASLLASLLPKAQAQSGSGINVTSPVSAISLATLIAGPGIVVTGASLLCARPEQAGTFENFVAGGPAVVDSDDDATNDDNDDDATDDDDDDDDATIVPAPLSGAIIGSAFAEECELSDDSESEDEDDSVLRGRDELNGTGSAALDGLLPTYRATRDACILHIDFICPQDHDRVAIQYVFGSNNYPSNGTTPDEDLMGAFLNGQLPRHNVARAPLSPQNDYLSVNTLFSGVNYVDNQQRQVGANMNGFTKTISSVGDINPSGANFMEIVIADGGSQARRNLREAGASRGLQVDPSQASGSWVLLTTSCMTCIRTTDTSVARGQTPVRTCAQLAGSTSCQCGWNCMLGNIKRKCVYTGSTASYNTYVSQVRTNIEARFCRR